MTDKQKELDHIDDMLIDDILETSDAEIRQEIQEETGDAEAEATRLRALVGDAIHNHKKAKFEAAKKERLERKQLSQREGKIIPFDRKKQILGSLSSNNDVKGKITMAARNETELSENDVNVYWKYLIKQGIIDDEGNVL